MAGWTCASANQDGRRFGDRRVWASSSIHSSIGSRPSPLTLSSEPLEPMSDGVVTVPTTPTTVCITVDDVDNGAATPYLAMAGCFSYLDSPTRPPSVRQTLAEHGLLFLLVQLGSNAANRSATGAAAGGAVATAPEAPAPDTSAPRSPADCSPRYKFNDRVAAFTSK